ncbi:hypothetical protein KH5_18910 [Urechidicola sp. KH5]
MAFGSMQNASSSTKRNVNLRRDKIKSRKDRYLNNTGKRVLNKKLLDPKISPEELEKIKAEIRARGKKRRLIEYSALGAIVTIISIVFYFVLFT